MIYCEYFIWFGEGSNSQLLIYIFLTKGGVLKAFFQIRSYQTIFTFYFKEKGFLGLNAVEILTAVQFVVMNNLYLGI